MERVTKHLGGEEPGKADSRPGDELGILTETDEAALFRFEYQQLKARIKRLSATIRAIQDGNTFIHVKTPVPVLKNQLSYMQDYLSVLEISAKNYENVKI